MFSIGGIMKSLISIGLIAFAFQATAKTISVSVQCFVPGPRMAGSLEVPDAFEGGCYSERNTMPWQIKSSPQKFSLSFNDLEYVETGMTLDFQSSSCTPQTFLRASSEYGSATETHSHYKAALTIEFNPYNGVWSGEISPACTFASQAP